jgi:hypothetical protein
MDDLRGTLARSTLLKAAYHWLRAGAQGAVCRVSPELLSRLRFRAAWGRWPDFENPTNFDEKLLWLNLFWRHPLKTECADKYTLRKHLEKQQLGHLLPRLYGAYLSPEEIDLAALPERFVLKCSHGAKCCLFCKEKQKLDMDRTRRALARWLATDYSTLLGELHYAGMTPRIVCEEFLEDGSGGELPTDYKLYCFAGHVHCTMVCSGRRANDTGRFDYFDPAWQRLPHYWGSASPERSIPTPAGWDEMVSVAERLSGPFPFVRVDFYSIRGRAILGEMTFTPGACIEAHSEAVSRTLGDLIALPDKFPGPA